jgi:hypothetical protein
MSDAAGEVSFDGIRGEPIWIQARGAPDSTVLVHFTPGTDPSPLVLQPAPSPPHGVLDVHVVDWRNDPVAGAEVKLTPVVGLGDTAKKPDARTGTTDGDGVARLVELVPGIWSVSCFDFDRGIGFGAAAVPEGSSSCVLRTH